MRGDIRRTKAEVPAWRYRLSAVSKLDPDEAFR